MALATHPWALESMCISISLCVLCHGSMTKKKRRGENPATQEEKDGEDEALFVYTKIGIRQRLPVADKGDRDKSGSIRSVA